MFNDIQPVTSVEGVTFENVSSDILNSSSPLVLRGFANSWKIVRKANLGIHAITDYLLSHYQGIPVTTYRLNAKEKGRVFYNADFSGFNYDSSKEHFNNIIKSVLEAQNNEIADAVYVGSTSVDSFFSSLSQELPVTQLLDNAINNIWLGNRSRIAAHYDLKQNLACVVAGRRQFLLFPPEQVKNLYVGPLDKAPGGQEISLVDFKAIDLKAFPRVKDALESAQIVTLDPGDALILPTMWWHQVEGLDDFNVLLNYWWNTESGALSQPKDALLMAMMTIRDLPEPQKTAWRSFFEHFVFDFDEQNFEQLPAHVKGVLQSPIDRETQFKLRAQLQNHLRR